MHLRTFVRAEIRRTALALVFLVAVGSACTTPVLVVAPSAATVTSGESQQFAATLDGAPVGVSWSVAEADGGTIDANGLYTAPTTPGTYSVVATHGDRSATATVAVVAPAQQPVISAPARVSAGEAAQATVPAQPGSTYAWTLTGGTLLAGGTSETVSYTSDAPGEVQLSCVVTNAAGTASPPGTASTVFFTTLTTLKSSTVDGTPANGVVEYDSAQTVSFAFTPTTGHARAIVEVSGGLVAASGTVTMDQPHWLWAFGEPETGTDFTDMVAVPNDPTLVPYPAFYAQRPAMPLRVADPYCAVDAPVIAYPKSYLGAFPMPETVDAPLPASVPRGVTLKDYWAVSTNNPTTNDGCSSDWHAAVELAIERIKRLGADHVGMYQNAMLEDATASVLKFDCMGATTCTSWAQVPDQEILRTAERAAVHGLKTHLYLQVDVADILGNPLPTAPSEAWVNAFFDAYQEYMVHIATLAETAKIEALQVDWGVWWLDWSQPQYQELLQTRMTQVAIAIRGVFSGKLMLGTLMPWAYDDADLMAQIDWLMIELFGIEFSAEDNANVTTAQLKQKYSNVIANYANVFQKYGKPAMFRVSAESYRDYLLNGWIEDGFCTHGCMQQDVEIDFSIQALAIQAQLEAIEAQTAFELGSVDVNSYWFADVILPATSFPNLSHSIRNKPAESIVLRWFER